ncbi:exonuclease [Gordonia phage Camerico]|nr:exonuclease [Gordonia phage Camerico]
MAQPKFAILDVETTGLDPKTNIILEIGIQLYTANLEFIAENSFMITDENAIHHVEWLEGGGNNYVLEMHTDNGLLNEIKHAYYSEQQRLSHATAEQQLIDWLESYSLGVNEVKLPLCGSSIHFDRRFMAEQMPRLNESFHYRNIDVSSVKEITRVFRPEVLAEGESKYNKANAAHRVLQDCRDSRDELAFYVESLWLATDD